MIPKIITKLRDMCLEILPINSPKYSSEKGNNIINNGSGNQHVGDNHNIFISSENVVVDQKNWKNLIEAFEAETIKRIIFNVQEIKQKGHKDHFENNVKGSKNFFLKKFEQIKIHAKDPKAPEFMAIEKDFSNAFESLVATGEEKPFQDKAEQIHAALTELNNKP